MRGAEAARFPGWCLSGNCATALQLGSCKLWLVTEREELPPRTSLIWSCHRLSLRMKSAVVAVLCIALSHGAAALTPCTTGPDGARPADVYVPVDNWVYPALERLDGMGYLNTAFLGLRPWTRRSIQRMLEDIADNGSIEQDPYAKEVLSSLQHEFGTEDAD